MQNAPVKPGAHVELPERCVMPPMQVLGFGQALAYCTSVLGRQKPGDKGAVAKVEPIPAQSKPIGHAEHVVQLFRRVRTGSCM